MSHPSLIFNILKPLAIAVGLLLHLVISMQSVMAASIDTTRHVSNQAAVLSPNVEGLFHHHIHNFYFNDSDKSKPNYLAMQSHALAMSYEATTHYLANTLPSNLDGLKRILLHNAYYIPMSIDFDKRQVKYTVSYLDAHNRSLVNADRIVWNSYPLNAVDIEILKGYGCAQSKDYVMVSEASSLSDAKKWFRIDKDYGKVIANWQSRFVVEDLAKKTIQSLQTGKYDYLFFDDLPRDPGDCINKEYGGIGSYSSWKEGQLSFLKAVTDAVHSMKGRHRGQIKVFGNIWSPYADTYTARWYASKELRLDHYYFESAGFAREDVLYGQTANGKDPETRLPAFMPLMGGFIPANLVSVGTHIRTMYSLTTAPVKKEVFDEYMMQHYKAAGIGATQGSWFGWYGETSLDKVSFSGKLIHSNAMQLLRAIPNWDNIAKLPLSSRKYDQSDNIYISPNSRFSNSVIQGWNPLNNEIYAVFRSRIGQIDLMGKKIRAASFVNQSFNKTGEDALPCLTETNGKIMLICADKTEQGIRITLE